MKGDGEHLRDLYRYEPGGSVAASGASGTAWSPDGTRLALAVENLGSGDGYWARHIWVIEADGSNMVQLTSGPQWDNFPSWSPDGNQIAFHRSIFEGDSYIVTIDVDGSNETPLTAGSTKESSPSWSPDGATIGYVTEYGQVALMAPDGSNRREIVANHAVLFEGMSWSPDSSQIAYTRDLGECTGIVLINADGTDERRISYLPGDSSQPAWSPDGELLLFANAIVRGLSKIYIVSVHGGSRDGLEEGCAQVERYEPNQDVAAPDDWRSRLPQEAAPASALECRPPDLWRGGFTVGFPRPTWVPSVGKLRIAVLFVDFPDGVADYSTREEAEHDEYTFGRTNLVAIEEYLETASYGKLDVEMVPLHGWLRARHSLTAFFTEAGKVSEDISVEAVELALAEMDFSEIDVVVTVLPSAYFYGGLAGGAVQISDKLIPTLQIGLRLNHVINDTAGPWGFAGTHELAHVLGLTDLYPMKGFDIPSPPADMKWVTLEVGLMGLQGRYLAPRSATGVFDGHALYAMLAWSRWQLGWLEPSQIRCIVEPSATVTLTAIDQPGDGVAMIAVPVGETEVIVIESRRIRAFDRGVFWGYDRDVVDVVNDDGVLVYTVGSSLRELPIRFATDGGEGFLDQSPILPVGTSITVKGYEITVVEDTGDTHTVRVSKTEQLERDDHGNSERDPTDIRVGTDVRGTLDYDDDIDYFRFQAEQGESYQIDVALGTLDDSIVYLYDADGSFLDINDDYGGTSASRLYWEAPSNGVYYVAVTGFYGVGTYTLTVSLSDLVDDHANSEERATEIRVGEEVRGAVGSRDDIDYFHFKALRGQIYRIYVARGTLDDSAVYLHDTDGSFLGGSVDRGGPFADGLYWEAPSNGERYVAVEGVFGIGSYTLTVSLADPIDDHGNSGGRATEITGFVDEEGADVRGAVDYDGDIDYFRFYATNGFSYQIDVALRTLDDSIVDLYDADGSLLDSNDNYGGTFASRLYWEAPNNGEFYVAVEGHGIGTYTLMVSIVDDHSSDFESATRIAIGEGVRVVLHDFDDRDALVFSARHGTEYVLTLDFQTGQRRGDAAGTIMALYDAGGRVLARLSNYDFSSSRSRNKIMWQAATGGDYYIVVGNEDAFGIFALTVTVR